MKPELSVPWYRSFTVWLGLLAVAVAALQEFASVFPGTVSSEKALAIAGVLTILLRLTNSKPIQGTPKEAKRVDDMVVVAEEAVKFAALASPEPGLTGMVRRNELATRAGKAVRKAMERNA
ncbi:MAG: hypothetical protein ACO1SV_21705 [Fimbriimonas sp.]